MCDLNQQGECCFARSEAKDTVEDIWMRWAEGSVMAQKSIKKIAAKDADQYMLRLPPGLRDRVARQAAENGRSMNTEIVEAIEHHLTRANRVTVLWQTFEKHQGNIEAIPSILLAISKIEDIVETIDRETRRFRWDSSPHSNVWELPNGSGPGRTGG
jgi:hypothetical protein